MSTKTLKYIFNFKQVFYILTLPVFISCSVSRNYSPVKKYGPESLRKDYSVMREILESKHPNLYWYTPKDEMNDLFDTGLRHITDSMTENEFRWRIIAPVLGQIRCGHTSVMASKEAEKYFEDRIRPSFPLVMKIWDDSMMVVANMSKDSLVRPGDFITAINGISVDNLIKTMFQYIPTDGYSENLKYLRLSSGFSFYYRNIFGPAADFEVLCMDSSGNEKVARLKLWPPLPDSVAPKKVKKKKSLTAKQKRKLICSLTLDSSIAVMDVNAFTGGSLNTFFRRSFRKIRKRHIPNLIVDLRINGGGDMNKAVKLAQYIRESPFKVADSVYSIAKNFDPYSGYVKHSFWNNLALVFISKKKEESHYTFGYWERHVFRLKRKNHFDGNIYILTSGLTFSAASLFCSLLKDQENTILAGEETGGGWYGNTGVLIPDIILPETKLRVRLPFFRLINYQHDGTRKGEGVQPDWYIGTNWRDILQKRDTKMEAIKHRIKEATAD